MEESYGCEPCRTWEEGMYWKHFNFMHFFLFLPKDFQHHLVLPAKFAKNMRAKLPDQVSLMGPSGLLWDIKLKKSENIEFVGDGWTDFVKAYGLREENLLMFKYEYNSSFQVLIFNPESFCEKEASYFVKPCRHGKADHENRKKRRMAEAFRKEVTQDEDNNHGDHNDSEFVVSKKSRNDTEEPGRRNNPQTPSKSVLTSAPQCGGGPKRMVEPCQYQSKSKSESEKESEEDGAIDDVVEKELEENGALKDQTQASEREQNIVENGVRVVEAAHSDKSTENEEEDAEENELVDDRDEQEPNDKEADKELSHTSEREENALDVGVNTLEILQSDKSTKEKEKDPEENGFVCVAVEQEPEETGAAEEQSCDLERVQNTSENGGNVIETSHSHKSADREVRLDKQVHTKPSSSMVLRSVKYSKTYKSNRRLVTEAEKEDAVKRALQGMTDESFIGVMRSSAVYTRFYVNVPAGWMNKSLVRHNREVVLRMGGKTWLASFYCNSRKEGGISGRGWKKFALENFLEEFDVCLFKLASKEDDPQVVMDVEIFRVIPEIVPLSPVRRSRSTSA